MAPVGTTNNLERLSVSELMSCFLNSGQEKEAQAFRNALLVQHADPVIKRVVGFKMKVAVGNAIGGKGSGNAADEGADEIYCRAWVALARQMERWRKGEATAPTEYLNYVAVIAYNEWKHWLKDNRPGISNPAGEVNYLLTRHADFSTWHDSAGRRMGGYRLWKESAAAPASDRAIAELMRDAAGFTEAGLAKKGRKPDIERSNPVHLMAAIFDQAGGPLEVDLLTAAFENFAPFRRVDPSPVKEVSGQGLSTDGGDEDLPAVTEKADIRTNIERQQEHRDFLRRLWVQVKTLPKEQRIALLQNLQDGDIRDLHALQVATFSDIGDALGKSPTELSKIWKRLPLDDSEIAAELKLTEPQVKNLRQAASRTLGWRMRPFDRGALRDLWLAATKLERPRPAAAMLYLRDAHAFSILALLPRESVANRETISERLPLDITRLNEAWPRLPLGFSEIAGVIGRPPHEVSSLYADACQALNRQLKEIWTEA